MIFSLMRHLHSVHEDTLPVLYINTFVCFAIFYSFREPISFQEAVYCTSVEHKKCPPGPSLIMCRGIMKNSPPGEIVQHRCSHHLSKIVQRRCSHNLGEIVQGRCSHHLSEIVLGRCSHHLGEIVHPPLLISQDCAP